MPLLFKEQGKRKEITKAPFERIVDCPPLQRGNLSLTNLQVINAILSVAEQGCKGRGLPKRFGNWHTIYTRMRRWSKAGVLERIFERLQHEQIVRVKSRQCPWTAPSSKSIPTGPVR